MKQKYFSEDELEVFLRDIEENDMHEAPFYLKEKILKQAFMEQELTYHSEKRKLSKHQKKKWLIYNCKVVLASAAAIILLFLLPSGEWQLQNEDINAVNQVTNSIGVKSEQICNILSVISNKMIKDYETEY